MKNKRIRFDDRLYWASFSLMISLFSLILLVTMYDIIPLWRLVILSVLFSLFLAGVFIFPKVGVLIDYKNGTIKYFGYIKINPSVIKMKDIQKITFIEIPK